jgi:hypothetical protein
MYHIHRQGKKSTKQETAMQQMASHPEDGSKMFP